MPPRSQWTLAREGVTSDTIGRLLKLTVLNPALTLPLLLLGRYTTRGNILAEQHGAIFKHLKTIVGLGLLKSVTAWLDDAVLNNWTNDTYVWSKEIVVVTGGSDGIGKIVVQLLAERGIKVAVLDVQELTYEGKGSSSTTLLNHNEAKTDKLQLLPPSAISTAICPPHRPSLLPPRRSAPPSATPPSLSTMQA
jgi:hypothetical protein